MARNKKNRRGRLAKTAGLQRKWGKRMRSDSSLSAVKTQSEVPLTAQIKPCMILLKDIGSQCLKVCDECDVGINPIVHAATGIVNSTGGRMHKGVKTGLKKILQKNTDISPVCKVAIVRITKLGAVSPEVTKTQQKELHNTSLSVTGLGDISSAVGQKQHPDQEKSSTSSTDILIGGRCSTASTPDVGTTVKPEPMDTDFSDWSTPSVKPQEETIIDQVAKILAEPKVYPLVLFRNVHSKNDGSSPDKILPVNPLVQAATGTVHSTSGYIRKGIKVEHLSPRKPRPHSSTVPLKLEQNYATLPSKENIGGSSSYVKSGNGFCLTENDSCEKQLNPLVHVATGTVNSTSGCMHKGVEQNTKVLFACPVCPEQIADVHRFVKHSKTHSLKPFRCSVCACTFQRLRNFHSHACEITNSAGKKLVRCDLCICTFPNRTLLRKHALTHSADKPYRCLVCSKCFTTDKLLKIHLRKHHSGIKPPPIPSSAKDLVHCSICSCAFKSLCGLKVHVRRHIAASNVEKEGESHTTGTGWPYKCSKCPSAFSKKNICKKHLDIHNIQKPYVCPLCSGRFVTAQNLRRHIRRTPDCSNSRNHIKERQNLQCSKCEFTVNRLQSLRRHMAAEHGEKFFTCSQCSRSFTEKHLLKRHIMLHTGIKPYACSQCPRTFRSQDPMRKHERLHEEKKYRCSVCYVLFSSLDNMRKHFRMHSGALCFLCPACPLTFNIMAELQVHVKTHVPQTSQPDPDCNKLKMVFRRTDHNTFTCMMPSLVYSGQRTHQAYESVSDCDTDIDIKPERVSPSRDHNDDSCMSSVSASSDTVDSDATIPLQFKDLDQEATDLDQGATSQNTNFQSDSDSQDVSQSNRWDVAPEMDTTASQTESSSQSSSTCIYVPDKTSSNPSTPKPSHLLPTFLCYPKPDQDSLGVVSELVLEAAPDSLEIPTPPSFSDMGFSESDSNTFPESLGPNKAGDPDQTVSKLEMKHLPNPSELISLLSDPDFKGISRRSESPPSTLQPSSGSFAVQSSKQNVIIVVKPIGENTRYFPQSSVLGQSPFEKSGFTEACVPDTSSSDKQTQCFSGSYSEQKVHNLGNIAAAGALVYQCSRCSYTFKSGYSLKIHMRSHKNETPYRCVECSHVFRTEGLLGRHMKTHLEKKSYRCSECPAAFTSPSEMKIHKRIHSGERPFQCPHCPRAFKSMSERNGHMKFHSDDKPFTCPECPSSFRRLSDLKVHVRIHSGEKPYLCPECGSAFKSVSELKSHSKTHTRDKPFKCLQCPSAFRKASDLKVHTRTHTGEKPYLCSQCPSAFKSVGELKGHARRAHREKNSSVEV